MVYDVVQIPVLQTQLFQLLLECLNLFACQLLIDTGAPALSCPGSTGSAGLRLQRGSFRRFFL